jgi:hypothetical protein
VVEVIEDEIFIILPRFASALGKFSESLISWRRIVLRFTEIENLGVFSELLLGQVGPSRASHLPGSRWTQKAALNVPNPYGTFQLLLF